MGYTGFRGTNLAEIVEPDTTNVLYSDSVAYGQTERLRLYLPNLIGKIRIYFDHQNTGGSGHTYTWLDRDISILSYNLNPTGSWVATYRDIELGTPNTCLCIQPPTNGGIRNISIRGNIIGAYNVNDATNFIKALKT